MNLSDQQLSEMRSFISKRGFSYVDLQHEIINRVEGRVAHILAESPNTSVSEAIRQVHQSFGVMGFSSIEDDVQASLYKRYSKKYWSTFLWVFEPKSLVFTLLYFAAIWWLQTSFSSLFLVSFSTLYLVIISFDLIKQYLLSKKNKYQRFLAYRIVGFYTILNTIIFVQLALRIERIDFLKNVGSFYLNGFITLTLFFVSVAFLASIRTRQFAVNEFKKYKN